MDPGQDKIVRATLKQIETRRGVMGRLEDAVPGARVPALQGTGAP